MSDVATDRPEQASSRGGLGLLRGRRLAIRTVLGAACGLAGVAASIAGAHALAGRDSSSARRAFQASAADVAQQLSLSLQRQQDLRSTASVFLAGHPLASQAEWDRWTRSDRFYPRHPDLRALVLVALSPLAQPPVASTSLSTSASAAPSAALNGALSSGRGLVAVERRAAIGGLRPLTNGLHSVTLDGHPSSARRWPLPVAMRASRADGSAAA